jgi:hypothetical protein
MYRTTTHLVHRATTAIADVHVRRAVAIVLAPLALALVGALSSVRSAPQVPPATPLPVIIIVATPTAAAAAPPLLAIAAAQTGLPRAVVAYDRPDGAALGAIEAGRAYTLTARLGDTWLQADVAQSGQVWIHASDLFGDLASLPDVATPIPAPAVELPQIGIMAAPQPTVDHAACCELYAPERATRREMRDARATEAVQP